MIQSILAAIDTTPRATGVFASALELAERFQARLYLFRAIEPPPDFPPAAATHPNHIDTELQERTREELVQHAQGHPQAFVMPPNVSFHEPWRSILAAAQQVNVDLIVIGSHGYRGWDRVLGTTAAHVVNHADRDVLVVHDRKTQVGDS